MQSLEDFLTQLRYRFGIGKESVAAFREQNGVSPTLSVDRLDDYEHELVKFLTMSGENRAAVQDSRFIGLADIIRIEAEQVNNAFQTKGSVDPIIVHRILKALRSNTAELLVLYETRFPSLAGL